jgi:hypothetical protein
MNGSDWRYYSWRSLFEIWSMLLSCGLQKRFDFWILWLLLINYLYSTLSVYTSCIEFDRKNKSNIYWKWWSYYVFYVQQIEEGINTSWSGRSDDQLWGSFEWRFVPWNNVEGSLCVVVRGGKRWNVLFSPGGFGWTGGMKELWLNPLYLSVLLLLLLV